MIKKILLFLIFIFMVSIPLKVYASDELQENTESFILDEGDIFTEEEINKLNQAAVDFKTKTQYNVVIHTIESLNGETIDVVAEYNYLEKFTNNNTLYILISKNDGDMIIKYGDSDSNIITNELIKAMMMSVNSDFENNQVEQGLEAALFNGAALIQENLKLNVDNHETLEINKDNKSNIYIIICTIAGVVFIGNLVYFFIDNKKHKKEKEEC